MTYRTAYFCVACKKEVDSDKVSYNRGTCPLCGHTHPSTIIETIKISYRWTSEKRDVSFFKIFSIRMTVPVREFKKSDIEEHGLILTADNVTIV